MPYTPTSWVDGSTPVNATNLNKIETGIDDAHTAIDAASSILNRVTTVNDIVSSSAENTLFTHTLSAGQMGTDRMLRLFLMGTFLHVGNTETMIVRLKLGGTTIIADTMTNNTGGSNRQPWTMEVNIANCASASVNFARLLVWTTDPPSGPPTTGYGDGAFNGQQRNSFWSTAGRSAIDTSGSVAVAITCQWSVANANHSWRLEYGLLELV